MYYRQDRIVDGQPRITLRDVSRRFRIHQDQQRSFQDLFINLFGLRKRPVQNGFWPLRDVSFDVMPGESLGIIGPNGSGKSTLLKLITGVLEPTQGDIRVNGRISALLELGAGFHPDLTGRENIFLNGSMYGLSRRDIQEKMESIIAFSELGEFIDMPIKHYSSGMYVRLGFAVAIHTEPDLLVVDEVLAVGDAAFQNKCMNEIQKFRQRGGTLLLVSHDLGTIQSICDRAIWYEGGQIQMIGHPTEVVMGYLNHVAEKTEAARPEEDQRRTPDKLDQGQRWGTGRVEIINVQLCDGNGAQRSVFATGDPMEIRLRYRAEPPIEDPVFGIAIHHHSGALVTGPNTNFGNVTIPLADGEGEVIYRVPSLSLLAGGYTLSVAVVNRPDTEMYDYHDRAYPFQVHSGQYRERHGLVTLNGQWRVTDTTPEAVSERKSALVG